MPLSFKYSSLLANLGETCLTNYRLLQYKALRLHIEHLYIWKWALPVISLAVCNCFAGGSLIIMHVPAAAPCPSLRWASLVPASSLSTMSSEQQTTSLPQPSAQYFQWDYRLQLITLGFGFYSAIFLLSHLLSVTLCRTYNSLLAKEKVFWNLAATRAVFGIQGSVAGLWALTADSVISSERVRGQEDWSWFTVLTATGFFVFENVALHVSSLVFWSFDLPLAIHHFFAVAGYVGTLVWDSQGHFLPLVTLLLEMSTPFTCISWMLLKVRAS